MPKLLEFVEAAYPAQAKQDRLEAKVALRLTLDAQGTVTTAEVLGPIGHGFDEAAREAALRFRFEPAKRNGTPVPSRIVYPYEFRLPPPPPSGTQDSSPPAATEPSDSSFEETIEVTDAGESVAQRRRQSAEAVQVLEVGTVQREAVDLGEALARTEGVSVRRTGGLGSTSRFSLAGFTDEQIRFFIDGVPLELAGYGAGLANVPVNLIQRAETYNGVVPIRFGADALGGAVHLETDQDFQGTRASASYELGSYDTHRLTASVRHLHEPTGFLFRANGYFDDTQNDYLVDVNAVAADGSGRPLRVRVHRFHDAYRAGGAGIETGFVDQSWARRLLLRIFTGTYDKELQNDVEMSNPYGEVEYGETSGGATLRFEQIFSNGLSANVIAGYTYRRNHFTDLSKCVYDWYGRCVFVRDGQPGVIEDRPVERVIGQHTGFARLNLGWNVTPLQKLRLSLAPTVVDRAGEDRQLQAAQQLDPLDGERNLFNLVSGVEYELDAFEDRLENILFVKDYLQRAYGEKPLDGGDFSVTKRNLHQVGLGDSTRLRLSPGLYAKASYEWATRLPRPDEFFGNGLLIIENLTLKPETSHNINLGLTYETRETAVGDFRANVTGFGRLADQLIVLIGQPSYFVYQNVFAARALGVSGAAGWVSPGNYFSLDGNATWQDFRNTSSEGTYGSFVDKRIPNQPYMWANGSARFQLSQLISPRDELALTWNTRYIHEFFRAWEGVGQVDTKDVIDSQWVHSLSLTYVTRSDTATLTWSADVQNLTDARAYDFYGVQRPGRSLFAKLTVEFGN
ncbi:TonB-dependent siderophore myxochelin receptor MxcH [Stigmatella sp. ncwal1]|uniref:TonB-dependent siderophore myxochelin receptor MxcH n=1 Tax=Stigmatella ashevillensis TaxID=2995309 RepID=A0ABT5D1B2_9BACT|nr:TonB-dependent siderophore myxochelin receptor MxcH [Stigmatella ashevillena]MDC0707457.1 TonB-dependent siderophore myxochelin receptor MxcH [Stigmatella ashevillena]